MQGIPRINQCRRDRHRPLERSRLEDAAGTLRNTATAALSTLAPSFAQALPSLESQPTVYSHEVNGEMLYEFCAALVRSGLGTPEMWKKCSEDALTFAQSTIRNAIGAKTEDLLQRNVEYHLEVSDMVGDDSVGLNSGQLQVSISCGGCGFLKIGPALRALEGEAKGLGVAFYCILIRSLYRVLRIYDHSDAQAYVENLIEYAEADDEANRDQYEFPEVEKALPDGIRDSLKRVPKFWQLQYRRHLEHHSHGKFGGWIRHLLLIQKLARVRANVQDFSEFGNYDGPPLPSFLIVFEERDAISACFDEESQHMLEGSSEPALSVVFSPNNADEFARASRTVERFVRINQEMCGLIEAIQNWEKSTHESGGSDWRGASLRAL